MNLFTFSAHLEMKMPVELISNQSETIKELSAKSTVIQSIIGSKINGVMNVNIVGFVPV